MKNKILHQVTLSLPQEAVIETEIITDFLINGGVDPGSIVESLEKSRRFVSIYCSTASGSARVVRRIQKLTISGLRLHQKIVRKEEWIDTWKKGFRPFRISGHFEIVPAWLKGRHQTRPPFVPIYIDTSVAFGTGMHETTQFMVQLIERCRGRLGSFLDIGTGTGILALAALHCGARRVLGIDICADAVRIAGENLALNGMVSSNARPVRMMVQDLQKFARKERFDFVAANLVTHDLKVNAGKIADLVSPGGYLAASGVSIPNCRAFRETFDALPLKCVKILRGETWMAFLYKKL